MRLVLLAAAVALLAACRPVPPPPNPLADTTWELQALVQDGDSLTQGDGLPADLLRFEADYGFRSRSCNNCVGTYVLSDLHVVVRGLACTRRACPTEVLELDRYVAGRAGYRLSPGELVLRVDDPINGIDARLYFAPAAPGVWE
ncbi:MAG: META domain-containing protein [Rubricoccaceae bacterium]|nr:META domain-containing protein [Rubricoccaceae bacterium]